MTSGEPWTSDTGEGKQGMSQDWCTSDSKNKVVKSHPRSGPLWFSCCMMTFAMLEFGAEHWLLWTGLHPTPPQAQFLFWGPNSPCDGICGWDLLRSLGLDYSSMNNYKYTCRRRILMSWLGPRNSYTYWHTHVQMYISVWCVYVVCIHILRQFCKWSVRFGRDLSNILLLKMCSHPDYTQSEYSFWQARFKVAGEVIHTSLRSTVQAYPRHLMEQNHSQE